MFTLKRTALVAAVLMLEVCSSAAGPVRRLPDTVRSFTQDHCADCHQGDAAEAGLDFDALSADLDDPNVMARWVRIFDRVQDGEMPPADYDQPDADALSGFLTASGSWITQHQSAADQKLGRVRGRRLTRREIERTLHDLLCIDIPLAERLPEESRSAGFSTVANGQSMSHFQMASYLDVIDLALDECERRAFSSDNRLKRDLDPSEIVRRNPRRRTREPEMRGGLAVVWSGGPIFYGRLPATTAPEDGWYRFHVRVSGLNLPDTGGVWCTVRTGLCVSSAPLLPWVTSFAVWNQPKDIQFDAWLPKGHMLEIRPGDITLKRGRFAGGQVGTGEGDSQNLPGIAFHRITMEEIYRGPDNDTLRDTIYGDVKLVPCTRRQEAGLASDDPHADASQILLKFANRAFRRPVSAEELEPYLQTVHAAIDDGIPLVAALRTGFRAILCSPRFLYFTEQPGPLDDHAVASRLSYFLTGSMPDDELRRLADAGELRNEDTLIRQTDRILDAQTDDRFIRDLAAEWLDLEQISFTEPDRKLYTGFDPIVEHAMLDETHAFLADMLRSDSSVTQLVDAGHTFLNSRLARYYGIQGVEGDAMQRVELGDLRYRGGVMTQGSIMKVTANGSNTSPVIRGVWVSERILGVPIPPPPENVPAIEPDIRGAKTIREMLAKHRDQASCASCHVKIDPPGFALENFDPSGRWRDRYLTVSAGRRRPGPQVDPGYSLVDGSEFETLGEFKRLINRDPELLARNVAEKLITYGTGAPVNFADRSSVDEIAEEAASSGYGFRSILHAFVTHDIFLSK